MLQPLLRQTLRSRLKPTRIGRQRRLRGYRQAGVNRLSLGVQSFDDHSLSILDGFTMVPKQSGPSTPQGLRVFQPEYRSHVRFAPQTLPMALADLDQALDFSPEHLSWYQLTIEPNTVFFNRPRTNPAMMRSQTYQAPAELTRTVRFRPL